MATYKSPYTSFIAHAKPLTNVVYYKSENDLICTIYIDDNWNMYGTVQRPERLIIGMGRTPLVLNQQQCEMILLQNMPPACRLKTLKEYGLDKYDSAEIMYRTRGINLLDKTWLSWDINERAEDFHPLCNSEILAERTKDMIHFEDDEPNPPWDKFGAIQETPRSIQQYTEKVLETPEDRIDKLFEDN